MTERKVANVLVVDDEQDLRNLLVDTLGSLDVNVSAAASGKEAIDLAARQVPDLVIADLRLGDCSGLDVIDRLRQVAGDLPAVVITGYADTASLTEASRRRPLELMTKPLNLGRLQSTVRDELRRQRRLARLERRTVKLRRIARTIHDRRKAVEGLLDSTCAGLTCAYRTLSGQLSLQQSVIAFQSDMIAAGCDDQVFASVFRLFVSRSGPTFGVAMVCDENAQLNVIGRFGVPQPDELSFCRKLAMPVLDIVLVQPQCTLLDAGDAAEQFDPSIRKRLPGVTVLAVPLIPAPGELIGLAVLYRKGEQPFSDQDLALAEIISYPTATAVRRND